MGPPPLPSSTLYRPSVPSVLGAAAVKWAPPLPSSTLYCLSVPSVQRSMAMQMDPSFDPQGPAPPFCTITSRGCGNANGPSLRSPQGPVPSFCTLALNATCRVCAMHPALPCHPVPSDLYRQFVTQQFRAPADLTAVPTALPSHQPC